MRIHTVCKMVPGSTQSYYFFHHEHDVPIPLGYGWVPVTAHLPMQVVPRPSIPDGIVDTVAKYIEVFHKCDIEVTFEEAKSL